jgi:hypothetical protein
LLPELFVVKVKVLECGFGLWLGDNIVILSMVKRAHLLFLIALRIPPFKGGRPETPLLGKLVPHTGETFPLTSPHVSLEGGHGETFPQAPPHPGTVGNVAGAPPTLGDTS